MTDKIYYTYNDIHNLVKKVCSKIKDDNYEPDLLIAIGGGGYIPARILRNEFNKPLIGISVNYYNEKDEINDNVKIYQWITEEQVKNKKILLIDEVDDTRNTLHFIINKIKSYNPKEIGIAVLNNKIKNKEKINKVKYYAAENTDDKWIVYPWDRY